MSSPTLVPMFARHETFAPRLGWFKKTFDGVRANGAVFRTEDATLTLGVGKNMVRSMRFWAGATGLVVPRRLDRSEELKPSHFAEVVFSDDGWDPFLENPSTLWLLHWRMLSPGSQLPLWHFAFTDLSQPEFTIDSLTADAAKSIPVLYGFEKAVATTSIRRDSECLVHTYARRVDGRVLFDDSLACPFRTLGILELVPARAGLYRFKVGRKVGLHDDIILFAALEFAARQGSAGRSISIGRLLRSPMSPGRIFKLDEDSLLQALTRATQNREHLTTVDTAGVTALQFGEDPELLALKVLNSHFRSSGSSKRMVHLREEADVTRLPSRS